MLAPEQSVSGTYYISRCAVFFDTSALGASATVSAATFSVFQYLNGGNGDSDSLSVVGCTIASNTAYALGDFGSFGTTKYAADWAFPATAINAYHDFTLTDLSIVNQTGVSKFGLRTAKDISATAPASSNYLYLRAADFGSNQPKLVITYTGGNTGAFFQFF